MLNYYNLTFERNNRYLFENLSGELHQGECLIIKGPNGGGKSTLLRLFAGLLFPQAGSIHWDTSLTGEKSEGLQQNIHFIGHLAGVKRLLTVQENIQLTAILMNQTLTAENTIAIAKQVRLFSHFYTLAGALSAGQLRRLALTRLLISPRKRWILDEPTTSLDNDGFDLLNQLLTSHRANKGLSIISTHDIRLITRATHFIQLGHHHV